MNVVTKHNSNRKVLKESKDNKENSLISGINNIFLGWLMGFRYEGSQGPTEPELDLYEGPDPVDEGYHYSY
jgi:hypothetical protein